MSGSARAQGCDSPAPLTRALPLFLEFAAKKGHRGLCVALESMAH